MTIRIERSLLALALAAACGVSLAQSVSGDDKKFVEKAAMGGMAEVQAGQMAQQKGTSAAVKQFGAHMVQDHTKANDELKTIATGKGMQVPADTDEKHKKAAAKLQEQSGAKFDQAYAKQMVDDHQETVDLFEKQSKSGKDPELKAFATKTLPDLRSHLDMAKKLDKDVRASK